jgi:hypothetical protein
MDSSMIHPLIKEIVEEDIHVQKIKKQTFWKVIDN